MLPLPAPIEAVNLAIRTWKEEWNEPKYDLKKLFLTLSFSTAEIILEVSDRLRD